MDLYNSRKEAKNLQKFTPSSGRNRKQKRQKKKLRGVGWTRQYTSSRCSVKSHGTPENKLAYLQRQMKKIQEMMLANNISTDAPELVNVVSDSHEDCGGCCDNCTCEHSQDYSEVVNDSAKNLLTRIKAGEFEDLQALRLAEINGKNRKTVLAAIATILDE